MALQGLGTALVGFQLVLCTLTVPYAHADTHGYVHERHDHHHDHRSHHHHECAHDKFLARLRNETHYGLQEQMREANAHLNLPTTRILAPERAAELEWNAANPSHSITATRRLSQDASTAEAPQPAADVTFGPVTEFPPIRFKAQYQFNDADEDFATQLRTKVMPRAMWALSRVLRLRTPVRGNLKLPRQCTAIFTTGPNAGSCAETGDLCFGVLPEPVPESVFGDAQCGPSTQGGCEEVTGGEGIEDADMAVYVTARATPECGPSTTAHAVACVRDNDNWYGTPGRPLAGYINFCPRQGLAGSLAQEDRTLEALIDTAVHELIHTLFMSAGLFREFLIDGGMDDDMEALMIRTPTVRSQVRAHFDCPNAEGAPLENQGGAGTASSHWEETAFFSEVMVGVASGVERRVLSPITIALAVDSGWYEPNWVSAGFLRHGHLAGCEMLGDCALVDPRSRGGQNFCGSADRCRNHDTLGWCADSTLSECSLLRPLNGGDCKLPSNLLALFGSPVATSSGVHYGPSAICVGLPNERLSRPGGPTYKISEVCVASQCADDGSLSLVFQDQDDGGTKEYTCPPGEFVELGGDQGFGDNTRFGPCPPAEEVCPYKGCPVVNGNMCSGQGNCWERKCHCAIDRSGADCGDSLCWQDKDCKDGQFCSDTQECSWGTAPPPPPPMDQFQQTQQFDNYSPLVAVRVGYLRACVFFSDDNNNGVANLAIGERSQPSGPRGEVSLFLPGESETLVSPIRQEPFVAECEDSLSAKTNAALQFRSSAGLPAMDGTITVFSTAAHLTTTRNTEPIATAFGVPEQDVFTRDWLAELVDDDRSDSAWQESASIAAISIATVVTVEQAAQYLAQGDAQATGNAANMFLKNLVESPRSGTIFPCIRETACFLGVLANTVQNLTDVQAAASATVSGQESSQVEAPPPTATLQPTQSAPVNGWDTEPVLEDESVRRRRLQDLGTGSAKDQALAETVVMINDLIAQAYEGKGTDDFEDVLTRWGRLAFAAEGEFANFAGELGSDLKTADAYLGATTEAELERVARQHNPDLAEATRLDEKNILEQGLQFAKDWLQSKQLFGIKGFQWVAILVTIGAISICTFCFCCRKNIEKAATVPIQAVSQRLQRARDNGGFTAAFNRNRPETAEHRKKRHAASAHGGVYVPQVSGAGAHPTHTKSSYRSGDYPQQGPPVKESYASGSAGGVVLPPRGPPPNADPYDPANYSVEVSLGEEPAGYMGAAQEHTGEVKRPGQEKRSPQANNAVQRPAY